MAGKATHVRIGPQTAQTLDFLLELLAGLKVTKQAIAEAAIEEYRRKVILEATGDAYAQMREDTESWPEFEREMARWDRTASDGLSGL